ncbi:hypothetical protein GTQ34_06285 [Muricauda sp. JGD-17]|uniref:SMP-30/Gluconolactonase/LRE-like region domain-containing protein n=1 Tax=Flagellimonas ochracea TaxID=2696472 RepID=A0A964TAY3_9FLAO|nr:SMP-30/gluconolactonase/LRE family protein [Allomuricauda ochracea]NAY91519.1 hypothetical protein [Allomuricauda ochracea]
MKIFVGLFFLAVCVSHSQQTRLLSLAFEKDLIPEGIAIDAKAGKVYLNSLKYGKIVRCNLDGSNPEDFIGPNEHGYLSGFGMTMVGETLYALGNVLPKNGNKSILLLLNTESHQPISKYTIENNQFIYLNDLTVGENEEIYITDSESSDLYTINKNTNELEVFFAHDEIKHSNGIAISPNGKLLYLATYTTGIRVLEIASKKLLNTPNEHKGIDGLKYHQDHLYAIVNGRRNPSQNGVFQFRLNQHESEIVGAKKMWAFENPTDIPTTFALYEDSMYFVSDSQLGNLDQDSNQIIALDELKTYQLVQLRL